MVRRLTRRFPSRQPTTRFSLAGTSGLSIKPVLRVASLLMVRDAVRTGIGAGQLPISLVSQDIANGTLALWGDIEGSSIALWALYPSRRLLSARVLAFLEYLKAVFPTGAPEELAAFIEHDKCRPHA